MSPKPVASIAITLLATMSALAVHAAPGEPAGEAPPIAPAVRLAATCAACHGTAGDTQGNTLPRLAGQSQQALSASLHAFKNGQRESTIMRQIAKGYTDEQIEQLASYFAAQKKPEAAK